MEKHFSLLRITRQNFLRVLEAHSLATLTSVPEGFNNHILWNVMHVIVTHQLLLYGRTHTPFRIDQQLIDRFKRGTTPTGEEGVECVDFARDHLLSTVDWAGRDYRESRFGTYQARVTGYGAPVRTVEDAIIFNNVHEGMHYGQVVMLQRLLAK